MRTKGIAGALALLASTTIWAQHASDDPVASANDGFGLTLGLESIGLYGPNFVRGFSPQTAGNVRIEGLYFDQQGALSKRVVDGSTIRVGVSEVGYAFPAPTGVVDYDLRSPGDGIPSGTVVASAGPFEARGDSVDGTLPLIPGELQWQGRADFAAGIQQQSYTKDVASPTLPAAHLSDRPLRAYTTAALTLTEHATAYAGYTQGLEDSGVASSSADNRGAILPDARTWQADAGIRFGLTPQLKLIAGVFEIEKPYFNLDSHHVDRALGRQRASGLELSLSGEVMRNLNVSAALLWGEFKVSGPNLGTEGIGSQALNQARVTTTLDATYSLPRLPSLSLDLSIFHFSWYPASVDNVVRAPPGTTVALGGRYRFELLGAAATLRLQVANLTNTYYWNLGFTSPEFSQYHPRAYFGYLTVDF